MAVTAVTMTACLSSPRDAHPWGMSVRTAGACGTETSLPPANLRRACNRRGAVLDAASRSTVLTPGGMGILNHRSCAVRPDNEDR